MARPPNLVSDQGLAALEVLEVVVLNAQGQVKALEAKNRVVALVDQAPVPALEVLLGVVVVLGVQDPVAVVSEGYRDLGDPEEITEGKADLVVISAAQDQAVASGEQDLVVVLEAQGAVLKQLEATRATSTKNYQVLEEPSRLKAQVMSSMDTRVVCLCDLDFSYI